MGCDKGIYIILIWLEHFYSHIPCGMWHQSSNRHLPTNYFYSHIPCGMWLICKRTYHYVLSFLLTHPVWDVTQRIQIGIGKRWISTHTSRVGCDTATDRIGPLLHIFLLTHPVWDVTRRTWISCRWYAFLLTHPVWDVTIARGINMICPGISTHTSRVGCD